MCITKPLAVCPGWERGNLGCSWASVKTAVVEHTKQRQATLRDQCVVASSSENSTPPMGAPNAACSFTYRVQINPSACHCKLRHDFWMYSLCLASINSLHRPQ